MRWCGRPDAGTTVNAAYVEDHDNYYDIILERDREAIRRLTSVRMPSGDGYQVVYNPGGPGMDNSISMVSVRTAGGLKICSVSAMPITTT